MKKMEEYDYYYRQGKDLHYQWALGQCLLSWLMFMPFGAALFFITKMYTPLRITLGFVFGCLISDMYFFVGLRRLYKMKATEKNITDWFPKFLIRFFISAVVNLIFFIILSICFLYDNALFVKVATPIFTVALIALITGIIICAKKIKKLKLIRSVNAEQIEWWFNNVSTIIYNQEVWDIIKDVRQKLAGSGFNDSWRRMVFIHFYRINIYL